MKIGYLVSDRGIDIQGTKGASSHVRGFVGALKQLGLHVDILSPKGGDIAIPNSALVPLLMESGETRLSRALSHLFHNGPIEEIVTKYIKEQKPDLIYERLSPFSLAGGAICKKFGIPHFLEVNAPLAEQGRIYRNQALSDVADLMEELALKSAQKFVVLTDELKMWLLDKGYPAQDILMKPCGVDTSLFSKEGETIPFGDKIVLGFSGSLKQWHDIPMIINVFHALKSNPKIHLLIIGDGPMKKEFEALETLHPEQVTLTGAIPQEEVPKWLRSVTVALAPYPKMDLFYFSPLKIYEYMALGKAIVTTNIGQMKTLFNHRQSAMLVEPGDTQGYIQAVKELVDAPDLAEKLGGQAYCLSKHHTWHTRAAQWIKDVEKIVK